MHRNHQMLLGILIFFWSSSLLSQIEVNVDIKGINKKLEDNVRLYLSVEQQKNHPLMSEARLRRLHKKAPKEIAKAIQPYGYYRPVIESEISKLAAEKWRVNYIINPGPEIPISAFNFTLNETVKTDDAFLALINKNSLQTGKAFNHLTYEKFKSSLARLAADRGYLKARFVEHRVEIDLKQYQADINLNYDSGPRFHFGDVSLHQDVLNPDFLQRYITFKKGLPYSPNQLIDLQQALHDSDYFQLVEVSPGEADLKNNEVPVTVTLKPRKRNRYSIGLGYGTDTGARTKFGIQTPRVNRRGHRFDTEAKFSEIGYSLSARYRVPILNPRTDQLIYSAGKINEKTDTGESTIDTIGVSLNRSRNAWRESFSLNYQNEDYIISGTQSNSELLLPGVNWSRIWGNNFINTVDGLRFDIGLRGATEEIVSDTSFAQLQGGIKAISSLNQRNRIIARGSFGTTIMQEFLELPTSVRFFTGGSQSVRGYAYHSLGPVDEDNEVIGGKHLLVGSIEFEHSFGNKWGLALFYDTGNAIDNFADSLEQGAGFGFRWKSPVGPVRIDFANAISTADKAWRLHINIGPDL